MKRSSLLAAETGPFDRVAADGRPWNLFWFFLKLGSRAILTSYIQKMAGNRSVIEFAGAFAKDDMKKSKRLTCSRRRYSFR